MKLERIDSTVVSRLNQQVLPLLEPNNQLGRPNFTAIVRQGNGGNRITALRVDIDGKQYFTDKTATEQLLQLLRVPVELLEDLDDRTALEVLKRRAQKRLSGFCRVATQGDWIVGIRHQSMSDLHVLPGDLIVQLKDDVARALGTRVDPYLDKRVNKSFIHGYVLLTSSEHRVAGDAHQLGVELQIDYSGFAMPELAAIVIRVVCTNGLLATLKLRRRSVFAKDNEEFTQKLRAATFQTVKILKETVLPRIEQSRNETRYVTESVFARLERQLPRQLRGILQRAYERENLRGTTYHLVQALTRAANDPGVPPHLSIMLQRRAGDLMLGRWCPSCGQTIREPALELDPVGLETAAETV